MACLVIPSTDTLMCVVLSWRHKSKIQACEMMFLRRVEGGTRLDRVRNEDVRRSLGQDGYCKEEAKVESENGGTKW